MKISASYKMMFFGCLLTFGPFALSEVLGFNFSSVQILVDVALTFGLLLRVFQLQNSKQFLS